MSRLLDLHAAGRISDAALDNALRALAPPPPAAAPAPAPVSAAAAVRVMRFEDYSPEEQDQAVRDILGWHAPEEPAGTFHAEFHIVLFDDKGRRAGEYTMRGWADLTPAQIADARSLINFGEQTLSDATYETARVFGWGDTHSHWGSASARMTITAFERVAENAHEHGTGPGREEAVPGRAHPTNPRMCRGALHQGRRQHRERPLLPRGQLHAEPLPRDLGRPPEDRDDHARRSLQGMSGIRDSKWRNNTKP